jgi:thiol-disulfide isomerase/thioredoxin
LLYDNRKAADDIGSLAEDALTYATTFSIQEKLTVLVDNAKIGKAAYDFALPDTSGKVHRLSDFRGKVVIIDTWHLGCGACRSLVPIFDRLEKVFEGKPVQFISINMTSNRETWIKWIKTGQYTTPLALDLMAHETRFNGRRKDALFF